MWIKKSHFLAILGDHITDLQRLNLEFGNVSGTSVLQEVIQEIESKIREKNRVIDRLDDDVKGHKRSLHVQGREILRLQNEIKALSYRIENPAMGKEKTIPVATWSHHPLTGFKA